MSLAQISLDEIATMKVVDLKQHLKDLKLPLHGNKPELQKRLTDALVASKQATADNNNNNDGNPKKPGSSSASTSAPASAAPANKSGENNNNPPSSSESTTQGKNTNETTSTNTDEKNNASTENAPTDEDADKVPDSNGNQQNDQDGSEKQSAPHQKKLSNIKRIEVEGLPEELLVWETEETSITGKRNNGISRNLGVTTAELILQRQERIKKYGLQSMPEQVKRMLRKQRFNRNNNDNNPNKPQNNEENKDDTNATSNATNTQSDFSIQSVLAGDGTSEGLTREKLSQRKKRFGDVAVQSAFQESQQRAFENRNRNNRNRGGHRHRNRNQSYNYNTNRNNDNNAAAMNQSGNIHRNRDENVLDDRIRARMDRFGTKPPRENGNRGGFGRDWNTMDRRAQRHQDKHRISRRNNRDRSRSRQRNRDNESSRLDEELDNAVESTIHSAAKTGGIMKDFGSDEEYAPTAEDLERIEQRKKRFEG